MTKTVISCKNCTITEVWVQITGMPKELDPTNPYPLFRNLRAGLEKKYLEKKYEVQYGLTDKNRPVLINVAPGSSQISVCPPFWNGEIRLNKNGKIKIIRTGHQFFAFHSLFDRNNPYVSYASSFERYLKEIIDNINSSNIFETLQIIVRYINTIVMPKQPNGSFDMEKYMNINFAYRMNNPTIMTSQFNCEFRSNKNNIIGINTHFQEEIRENSSTNSILSIVRTTGVASLENLVMLNDLIIFEKIKSIKDKLKDTFFEIMTDETKNKIMGVQYEQ